MNKLLLFIICFVTAAHAEGFGPLESANYERVIAMRGNYSHSNRDIFIYVREQTVFFVNSKGKPFGHEEGYSLASVRDASQRLLKLHARTLRRDRWLGAGLGLTVGGMGGATAGFMLDFFGSLSQAMSMTSEVLLEFPEPTTTLEVLGGVFACTGAGFGFLEPGKNLACFQEVDHALRSEAKETTIWLREDAAEQKVQRLLNELNRSPCDAEMTPTRT